jgi:hypothetical protein
MQLSLDVVQLLMEDSVVTVLMFLTCRQPKRPLSNLSDSTSDAIVRYCNSFTVNKLGLTDDSLRVIRIGRIDLLKEKIHNSNDVHYQACSTAARSGQLEILKWFQSLGCLLGGHTTTAAAVGGHLEVFKWCIDKGAPVFYWICRSAAVGGNLELIQLCRKLEYWWNGNVRSTAAAHGHLELLQWCVSNGCPWNIDVCLGRAEENHHSHVVEWIHSARVV